MTRTEQQAEVQLMKQAVAELRRAFDIQLDVVMARLDNLSEEDPVRDRRRVVDWKEEVSTW